MTVRLLIVDDEAVIRALLQRHFVAKDYMVETAANGLEALQRLADAKYDIVITDLLMPEMDGHELLSRIRDEYPLIRVIVMTGAVSIDNMLACLREGAFTFVTKPLTDLAPLSDAVHVSAWIVQGWLEQLTLLQRMKSLPQDPS
jgi:CheY-like chemotaxis protein